MRPNHVFVARLAVALTIVISGCSSGFGALTAKALAAKGHHVIATMHNSATRNRAAKLELEASAKHGGFKLEVVDLDVTEDSSVTAAIASITQSHRRIDLSSHSSERIARASSLWKR